MLEEILKLEDKVNILLKYCKNLKDENIELKKRLSSNENDMYSLIEEKDILLKEKTELSEKINEIVSDNSRINSLIDTIDSAIGDYDSKSSTPKQEGKPQEVQTVVEDKKEKVVENNNIPKAVVEENKIQITQVREENIVHIKDDEDPFSKANDNDWDSEVENNNASNKIKEAHGKKEVQEVVEDIKEDEKQETKKEKLIDNEDYDFEIEDDDDYVFSDEDDEESGFVFDDNK